MFDFSLRHPDHNVFKFGGSWDAKPFPFKVCECACEASTLVGIIEYMASGDCYRVHGGDTENVVDTIVMRMVVDAG